MDLSTLFDYDLWATRRWLFALTAIENLERAHEILEHMLMAQRVWLERVGFEAVPKGGNVPMSTIFEEQNAAWKSLVEEEDLNRRISYSTFSGEPFTNTVGDIALHVVNHGTYHRGQLRGLAEAEGWASFPDTDLILFLRG